MITEKHLAGAGFVGAGGRLGALHAVLAARVRGASGAPGARAGTLDELGGGTARTVLRRQVCPVGLVRSGIKMSGRFLVGNTNRLLNVSFFKG